MAKKSHNIVEPTNELQRWLDNIKQSLQEKRDRNQKKLSNDQKRNEEAILNVLEGADFNDTKIPLDILKHKKIESQKCGDLEYGIQLVKQSITMDDVTFAGIDISEFDSSIRDIAESFVNALRDGNVQAVYAASKALNIAVLQLRSKFNTVKKEWRQSYVDKCTKYLERWKLLIDEAKTLDQQEKNLSIQEALYEKQIEKDKEKRKKFHKDTKEDKNLLMLIQQYQGNTGVNKASWPPELRAFHNKLVMMRVEKINLATKHLAYDAALKEVIMLRERVDEIRSSVASLPIDEDPNAVEKFETLMEEQFKKINDVHNDFVKFAEGIVKTEKWINDINKSGGNSIERQLGMQMLDELVDEERNDESDKAKEETSIEEFRRKVFNIQKQTTAEQNIQSQKKIQLN